ncbi:ATP-binding cassette domain-containing protein [Streptomyces californicus]
MGRNGSGKSSLLWTLQGSGPRTSGTVRAAPGGPAPPAPRRTATRRSCPPPRPGAWWGRRPQTPTDLLYLESVEQELDQADAESWGGSSSGAEGADGAGAPSARALLDRLAPGIDGATHPRDLSEGQKLALVLAIQLTAAPRVLLLDERRADSTTGPRPS